MVLADTKAFQFSKKVSLLWTRDPSLHPRFICSSESFEFLCPYAPRYPTKIALIEESISVTSVTLASR